MDKPAPIMNRGFAAVVAVPAWAEFMKQATAKDAADWFQAPADVEKVTICRLSGQLATDACRHGWMVPDYVQAGLTELPGVPADGAAVAGTMGHKAAVLTNAAAKPGSDVYDDYFTIGSAPTSQCALHGAAGLMGLSSATDSTASSAPVSSAATSGIVAASYSLPAPPPPASNSRLEKVTGADGRAVWVVKQ